MKSITSVLIVLAALAYGSIPLLVQAAQIAPNPNPAGSTIDVVNDPFAVNTATPFVNVGTIHVDSTSVLTNKDLCTTPHHTA